MPVHIESVLLARATLKERDAAKTTSRVDNRLTCKVVPDSG